MTPEPLIDWPQPLVEIAGFVSVFLAAGAIGFRFVPLGGAYAESAVPEERALLGTASRRAAALGVLGVLGSTALLAANLPGLAEARHTTIVAMISGNPLMKAQVVLLALALLGFLLALGGRTLGWVVAAVGVIGNPIKAAFTGQWVRLVNPLHELAGGLWIGTLFVMLVAGVAVVLRSGLGSQRRAALVARMINTFSPLALSSAALLATMGVITAWRNLKYFSALWTTPYGLALDIKLAVVLVVVSMGAFNWRRQKGRLGTLEGAKALQRSAIAELVAAGVVLAITSILVSLPSPKPPGS